MSGCLSIDRLLSEEERLEVNFLEEGRGMGVLDPTTADSDVPEDTRLDVPFWLAKDFISFAKAKGAHPLWKIELPKHYGPQMRDEIEAGAGKIRFRDFSYYYFEMGRDLAKHYLDGGDRDLLDKLRKAYAGSRYKTLTARALTPWNDDNVAFSQTLTAAEIAVLDEGFRANKEFARWRAGESSILKAASLLGPRHSSSSDGHDAKRARGSY